MKASHESINSSQSEKDYRNKSDTTVKSTSKATRGLSLYNVEDTTYIWKKENTCKNCGTTYENFKTLLNHTCMPYRCASCSMAFLFDYMLKMHKCGAVQSNGKNSQQAHKCTICGSLFFEFNSLLQHRSHCSKSKMCGKCGGILSVKNGSEFCHKCSLVDKDQKYFLRCKKLNNKFESTPMSSEVSSSGIESAVETDSGTTDQSNSTFNDVGSCSSLKFTSWGQKRKTVDDASERSSKKIKSKGFVKDNRGRSAEMRSVSSDRSSSVPNGVGICKNLNLSTWRGKTCKKNSTVELRKGVKSKNGVSLVSLGNKFKTKGKFEKRDKTNLLLNKGYMNSAVKDTVQKHIYAKQDIEMDLKKSVVSVLSQSGKRNQFEKKKDKFSSTSYTNSHKTSESKTVGIVKSNNVISSDYSRHFKKTDIAKAKKEILSSKKNKLAPGPVKGSSLVRNIFNGVKKINPEIVKKNSSVLLTNSKKKSHQSEQGSCSSNMKTGTPELNVSLSTLNFYPDVVSPVRSSSRSSPSHSRDSESEKNKSARKTTNLSNSNDNPIRLESFLDVLPDENSGILLKESSKTCDNFRCIKCNKLFKKVKMAAIHYGNCRSSRMKKKNLVSAGDIEWICLQCHFHCTQITDLRIHKKACVKPSRNAFDVNCAGGHSDTCLNYCPKCCYSCVSSTMFDQHPCEKRLEHMKKCYIDVARLPKVDSTEYKCIFCDVAFMTYDAYKRHIVSHTADQILGTARHNIIGDNLCAKRKIKSILTRPQILQTPEDIIKKVLEPISSVCSSVNSENLFPNLNLNLVIPKELETLLRGATEKILTEKEVVDDEDKSTENLLKMMDFSSQFSLSGLFTAGTSSSDPPPTPTNAWHTYMKDYQCTHNRRNNSNMEKKPCLLCLNDYIRQKGSFCTPEESFTGSSRDTLHGNLPATSSGTITNHSVICNTADGSVSHDMSNSAPFVNQGTVPIHIDSVESCSYEMVSNDQMFQHMENNNFVSNSACAPCSESELPDDTGDSNTRNSFNGVASDSNIHNSFNGDVNASNIHNSFLGDASASNIHNSFHGDASASNIYNSFNSDASVSNIHNSFNEENIGEETLSIVLFVMVLNVAFVDSKYTVETHGDLIRTLFNLKKVYMPKESKEQPQVKESEYHLMSDKKEDTLKMLPSCNKDSPASKHVTILQSQNNAHQTLPSLSNNFIQHSYRSDVPSLIDNPIHCAQSKAPFARAVFRPGGSMSQTSQLVNIDQCEHWAAAAIPSPLTYIENHSHESKVPCGSGDGLNTIVGDIKNYVCMKTPFSVLMKALVTQKPCDFELIAINDKFNIHISWQTCSKITYTAYTQPGSESSEVSFICGLCFDSVTSSDFLKHFYRMHIDTSILNVLIS